jgi:catechol 2,3-dioxygenase-like lactoylglutathione lyase family enzyme
MLTGAHVVIYSKNPEADRAFFKDILRFPSVDAGRGWQIFGLPGAEVAFHPHERNDRHAMYFLCDDLRAQLAALQKKGVAFGPISEERWGKRTTILLPSGGQIGLYEPKHPIAIAHKSKSSMRTKPKVRKKR